MLSTAEPGRSKGSSAGRALAPLRGAACGRVHHSAASTQLPLWGPASIIYESAAFSKEKDTKSVCLLN